MTSKRLLTCETPILLCKGLSVAGVCKLSLRCANSKRRLWSSRSGEQACRWTTQYRHRCPLEAKKLDHFPHPRDPQPCTWCGHWRHGSQAQHVPKLLQEQHAVGLCALLAIQKYRECTNRTFFNHFQFSHPVFFIPAGRSWADPGIAVQCISILMKLTWDSTDKLYTQDKIWKYGYLSPSRDFRAVVKARFGVLLRFLWSGLHRKGLAHWSSYPHCIIT